MSDFKSGLILKPPVPGSWVMGSGKATQRFGGDLNPSGDWTPYIPPFEPQSRPGFDPQSCALTNSMRAWITLANYLDLDFIPDGSERYLGAWSGTGPGGTDPYAAVEIARTICGLIPQESMPWTDEMTFETYYDKKMAGRNFPFGRAWLDRYELGFEWVFSFGSPYTPQEKAKLIEAALRRGPVCVSVSGFYRYQQNKLYKEPGETDTHWPQLAKAGTLADSYLPQFKDLAPNYDHQAAMVYFLKRKTTQDSFYQRVINNFIIMWKRQQLGI